MSSQDRNSSISLKAYLQDADAAVRELPSQWVRCELHTLKVSDRFTKMEFIELDGQGKQVAKANGGCFPNVWKRIDGAFRDAGLPLEEGSQVLVKLQAAINPAYGFNVSVLEIDVTFALGDLNARIQAIRKQLKDAGHWSRNRSLAPPTDFTRVAVISPSGAAGLGDFRSTADRMTLLGLVQFDYFEAPFQTRDAPARIVELLRGIYRDCMDPDTRYCAVAIIRGGGASADLAWLIDHKLTEAVCRMNVPVMTGIGHERDKNLLDEVSCISCDTPSKVAEYITSAVTRSAMAGQRAYEIILSQGVRTLDAAQAGFAEARHAIDRDAKETVRLADNAVRAAATGIEPGARALLDDTQQLLAHASEHIRILAGERREDASGALRDMKRYIQQSTEASLRELELGRGRSVSEISTRVEAVPQAALDEVRRLADQIKAFAVQTLDDCTASIAMANDRADALHPRTVLAAGYAILRDAVGSPLVGIEALRSAGTLQAETRDGIIALAPITTDRKEDDNEQRSDKKPRGTGAGKVRRGLRGAPGDRSKAEAEPGANTGRRRNRAADQASEPAGEALPGSH
ncbi:exodeoxyribonuclease VII large subunit [Sphingomonas sp. 3-13AW]|uniref:exodeoxyribonuclease VII large subunit n=1 Tax=Sphingomonas sp. 3-13AW TaxID=3050450 RepID=UPI003BB658AB